MVSVRRNPPEFKPHIRRSRATIVSGRPALDATQPGPLALLPGVAQWLVGFGFAEAYGASGAECTWRGWTCGVRR
jgi:hypothetical protein